MSPRDCPLKSLLGHIIPTRFFHKEVVNSLLFSFLSLLLVWCGLVARAQRDVAIAHNDMQVAFQRFLSAANSLHEEDRDYARDEFVRFSGRCLQTMAQRDRLIGWLKAYAVTLNQGDADVSQQRGNSEAAIEE